MSWLSKSFAAGKGRSPMQDRSACLPFSSIDLPRPVRKKPLLSGSPPLCFLSLVRSPFTSGKISPQLELLLAPGPWVLLLLRFPCDLRRTPHRFQATQPPQRLQPARRRALQSLTGSARLPL